MASVIKINRKTRVGTTPEGKPIWKRAAGYLHYAKIKTLAGQWVQVPTHQTSKTLALKWAADQCACDKCGGPDRIRRRTEEQVAKVQAAEEAKQRKLCGELMEAWIETLTNRSAADDRSRLKKYLRPHFGHLRPEDVKLPIVMQWIDKMRATAVSLPVGENGKPKRGRGRVRADDSGKLSDA